MCFLVKQWISAARVGKFSFLDKFGCGFWLCMALSIHRDTISGGSNKNMDNNKYVRYTPEQVEALERVYTECPKPSSLRRQQLIRECPILCNIEPKQIKVWFQNRRYIIEWYSPSACAGKPSIVVFASFFFVFHLVVWFVLLFLFECLLLIECLL